MFNSSNFVIIFVFMQYTNNILDLFVAIGYNIQSTVAYRSTGMELKPHSHCADVATVHPYAGQPVYRDAPGHIS